MMNWKIIIIFKSQILLLCRCKKINPKFKSLVWSVSAIENWIDFYAAVRWRNWIWLLKLISLQIRVAQIVKGPLLGQSPLKIWKKHSNCPLHSRGDSKTPIALLRPMMFLKKKMKKYFPTHKKAKRHDPSRYFSCPCRKFSEPSTMLFLSSTPSSQNM